MSRTCEVSGGRHLFFWRGILPLTKTINFSIYRSTPRSADSRNLNLGEAGVEPRKISLSHTRNRAYSASAANPPLL